MNPEFEVRNEYAIHMSLGMRAALLDLSTRQWNHAKIEQRRCNERVLWRCRASRTSPPGDETSPSTTIEDKPISKSPTKVLRGARQRSGILVDLSPVAQPRTTLPPGVLHGRFALSPEEVARLQAEHGGTEDDLMALLITPAAKLARPPISSFHVGAVGLGDSGALYVGVNLEFARLPLYNSVHAEQFLLVNALHHGERGIRKLAISAAPCGHCRQFYSELACAENLKFCFQGGCYTLEQLLPLRFKPADLLPDPSAPLLLAPQDHRIQFDARSAALVADHSYDNSIFGMAVEEALQEAQRSYSPYSRCPAGVAIVTCDDQVYSGGYIESAAYNPSMPPLQTAIIDAVIDGMPCYTEVKQVVLVELLGGPVQHENTTRVMLEQIAPEAQFIVLHAEWAVT